MLPSHSRRLAQPESAFSLSASSRMSAGKAAALTNHVPNTSFQFSGLMAR